VRYFLLSLKHSQGSVLTWWGPNGCGYTTNLDRAGLYESEEALKIQGQSEALGVRLTVAVPEFIAVPASYRVVDLDPVKLSQFGTTIGELQKARAH
jgi:hypothetical protein